MPIDAFRKNSKRQTGHLADAPRPASADWLKLRLVITLPAAFCLFTIIFGFISYITFETYWDEMIDLGAGNKMSLMLEAHLTALLVLAVLASAFGVWLAHSILLPVRTIVETAGRVATGRFDQYAPRVPAAREFDDLSTSFNRMIDDLNLSIAERNRRLIEGVPSGVATTDLEGRIQTLNQPGADLLGLPIEELIGKKLDDLGERLPERFAGMLDFLKNFAVNPEDYGSREFDLPPTEDGRRFTVSASVLRDSKSEPYGILLNFRDLAPIADLSEHLRRTDQLAAMGTFSMGLAHGLRNPIASIKGLGQLLQRRGDLDPLATDYIQRMVAEIDRIDALVGELLDLTSQPVTAPVATDLRQAVREADEIARRMIPRPQIEAITVHEELHSAPKLRLQRGRIVSALSKIIHNAYAHTPAGAEVRLHTFLAREKGDMVHVVRVSNTGTTIPPGMADKIFNPFFTTNTRATGLGLTIANQIVMQNGGHIDLKAGDGEVNFDIIFDSEKNAMMAFDENEGSKE